MKIKNSIALLLVVSMLAFVLVACSASKSITVTNNGEFDYCEIYYSPAGQEAWSENQLTDGSVVNPGGKFDVTVSESGDYDVKVVACDGAGEQIAPANVP